MGKYFFLIFSVLLYSVAITQVVTEFNSGNFNWDAIILTTIGATTFLILFLSFKDKFAIVEFGNQKLKIFSGDEIIEATWLEVESIKVFRFSSPPLYILRLNNVEGYFLFATSQHSFTIGGIVVDGSDLAHLIEKKKRDFDL